MTEHEPGALALAMLCELDMLSVPDGDLRRIVTALGAMMEYPDRPGHLVVAHDAWDSMRRTIHELYEPKAPLQEQRDYERQRRELAQNGMDLPAWEDIPEDQRLAPSTKPYAVVMDDDLDWGGTAVTSSRRRTWSDRRSSRGHPSMVGD